MRGNRILGHFALFEYVLIWENAQVHYWGARLFDEAEEIGFYEVIRSGGSGQQQFG